MDPLDNYNLMRVEYVGELDHLLPSNFLAEIIGMYLIGMSTKEEMRQYSHPN